MNQMAPIGSLGVSISANPFSLIAVLGIPITALFLIAAVLYVIRREKTKASV